MEDAGKGLETEIQKEESLLLAKYSIMVDFFQETKAGIYRGLPIVLGYFPVGLAFGVLAAGVGLTIIEATFMSVFVFAGSAQFIALNLWESQAGIAALTLTTFLVNLRHLLMSAALAPYLGHLNRWQQVLFAYGITDETFAVHSADFKEGKIGAPARIIATNLFSHLAWVLSSFLGVWAGSLLGNLERWGLDYALPAMFIALLVIQLDSPQKAVVAVLSLVLGVIFYWGCGGNWYVILATVLAATAGLAWEVKTGTTPKKDEAG